MTTWALLAPGPSATVEQAELVRSAGIPLGAVSNGFELAPWAEFLAASDGSWWRRHPHAAEFQGEKFCMCELRDAQRVMIPTVGSVCNSGVLGLEVAKKKGATRILLIGFDMHGSHFFGKYTNGLRNTTPTQREQHKKQFREWGRSNKAVDVINCTPKSALECFPVARLEEVIETSILEPAADQAGSGGTVCAGVAA
jgi:hypothetical protein